MTSHQQHVLHLVDEGCASLRGCLIEIQCTLVDGGGPPSSLAGPWAQGEEAGKNIRQDLYKLWAVEPDVALNPMQEYALRGRQAAVMALQAFMVDMENGCDPAGVTCYLSSVAFEITRGLPAPKLTQDQKRYRDMIEEGRRVYYEKP